MENLWRSHFSSSGPSGIFALSSSMLARLCRHCARLHDGRRRRESAEQCGDGDDHESECNDEGNAGGDLSLQRLSRRPGGAKCAHRRPCTVIEMKADKCRGNQVETGDERIREADTQVVVRIEMRE